MRLRVALTLLAVASCGRLHFDTVDGDGRLGSGDGMRRDGPSGDAIDLCDPVACGAVANGTCVDGTCTINCNSTMPACTKVPITCPAGMPCHVTCADSSCVNDLSCGNATSCAIECTGTNSCAQIECGGAGPCTLACSGNSSCGSVTCGGSACNIECTGVLACNGLTACDNSCNCVIDCAGGGGGCLDGVGLSCPSAACIGPSGEGCVDTGPCVPTC